MHKSEFGVFGLGVMGKSLCRNLSQKGFKISMYNRHLDTVEVDVAKKFKENHSELSNSLAFDDLPTFISSLERPRKIMLMVNAGNTIDYVIEDLLTHLSENDILIDGGNSNYKKTKERFEYLKNKNIHFIGAGVSGGQEGALKGPSIMPSGNFDAYSKIQPFIDTIAAKDENNLPCSTYIGKEGSGHFVKMVHNGIEYVEMQLLAEVYSILIKSGRNPDEIAEVLKLGKIKSNSYLLYITINILRKKEDKNWLIHKILDKAGNKGTGNWTTIASTELGTPYTMVASALFSRYISFYKKERVELENLYSNKNAINNLEIDLKELLNAYQFARIVNHYQGFSLIHKASEKYKWNLNLSEISRIWTSGCIIKSDLMIQLVEVFKNSDSILKDEKMRNQLEYLKPFVSKIVAKCVLNDLSIPCLSDSINFFNAMKTANSSANLIQAQRDFFGAHTYQRTDDSSDKFYHTNWK